MNTSKFALIFTVTLLPFFLQAASRDETEILHGALEPHISYSKTNSAATQAPSSPLLTYHQGPVLYTSSVYAIFWGAEWSNPSFASDKITGLEHFFTYFGGSNYSHTNDEYRGSAGSISPLTEYHGYILDSSAAPQRTPKTSTLVSQVCKLTVNNPDPNGIYFVYTSTKAGNVNYCAWHSWGSCSNGAKVQVAYMPNLDGIAACDPVDKASGNSQGLAALANVTAHELVEAITDPRGNAWYDSSGQENADKCAWSFPSGSGLSYLSDGSAWKLQMNWSNAAYLNGTGFANRSGQKGCKF